MNKVIDDFFDLLDQDPTPAFHVMQDAFRDLSYKYQVDLFKVLAEQDNAWRLKQVMRRGFTLSDVVMERPIWYENHAIECIQSLKTSDPSQWLDVMIRKAKQAIRDKNETLFESILTISPDIIPKEKTYCNGEVSASLIRFDWAEGAMLWWDCLKPDDQDLFAFVMASENAHRCLSAFMRQKEYDWKREESVLFFFTAQAHAYKPTQEGKKVLDQMAVKTSPDDAMLAFAKRIQLTETKFSRHENVFKVALEYLTDEGCYLLEENYPTIPWRLLGESFHDKATKHALSLHTQDMIQEQPHQRKHKL